MVNCYSIIAPRTAKRVSKEEKVDTLVTTFLISCLAEGVSRYDLAPNEWSSVSLDLAFF